MQSALKKKRHYVQSNVMAESHMKEAFWWHKGAVTYWVGQGKNPQVKSSHLSPEGWAAVHQVNKEEQVYLRRRKQSWGIAGAEHRGYVQELVGNETMGSREVSNYPKTLCFLFFFFLSLSFSFLKGAEHGNHLNRGKRVHNWILKKTSRQFSNWFWSPDAALS